MTSRSATLAVFCTFATAIAPACQSGDADGGPDEEWGMEGPMSPLPPPGKEDSEYRKGLLVNTDTTRTQVWTARNKWEDRTTTAAAKAGLAWPANSNLSWDEKYGRWIDSLEWIPALNGYQQTARMTTPWGKTLPSPALECAETAIFLRITFAAWYELPLFFEAQDDQGRRVYFGHNGVRTQTGRYASSPEFAIVYKDYTSRPAAEWMASWPVDATLKTKRLWGGEDVQDMIAPGAVFGAYVDQIHLNKRAGYFTVMALNYLSSVNLADAANAYNVTPESVRSGDVLIERWQRHGIGHTLVVKEVDEIGEGNKDVVTISGSMPRRQGVRESGVSSKSYFTNVYTGGPGTNSDGDEYARLGGGLKRFRVAKNIDGYWTNTWMAADEASWINSTDYPRIAARPARFGQLLGQVSPEQQRTELLAQINDTRRHLLQYPASCSARERREHAFSELYDLSERVFGRTRTQIDAEHRALEDYVFGELEYTASKTCCWNSSTAGTAEIVLDYARKEEAAAEAAGTCAPPTVFKSETNGYQRWAQHAASIGRAAEWRAWSEDEPCAQRSVASDTAADSAATPFCELDGGGGGGACTDALEPNEDRGSAKAVAGQQNLKICAGDVDWLKPGAGLVKITFTHADGDLDLAAFDAGGAQVATSQGTGNSESVTVPAGGTVKVYGYSGAQGAYHLTAP
jgi:hypothetical protein